MDLFSHLSFILLCSLALKYTDLKIVDLGCLSAKIPFTAWFGLPTRSFALMFCVSCNLVTVCHRYEDFSVASTISGLNPCQTTGKICRQSPAKSTVGLPNGDECFRMSCIVLSIDSNTCLCPIEIS